MRRVFRNIFFTTYVSTSGFQLHVLAQPRERCTATTIGTHQVHMGTVSDKEVRPPVWRPAHRMIGARRDSDRAAVIQLILNIIICFKFKLASS